MCYYWSASTYLIFLRFYCNIQCNDFIILSSMNFNWTYLDNWWRSRMYEISWKILYSKPKYYLYIYILCFSLSFMKYMWVIVTLIIRWWYDSMQFQGILNYSLDIVSSWLNTNIRRSHQKPVRQNFNICAIEGIFVNRSSVTLDFYMTPLSYKVILT